MGFCFLSFPFCCVFLMSIGLMIQVHCWWLLSVMVYGRYLAVGIREWWRLRLKREGDYTLNDEEGEYLYNITISNRAIEQYHVWSTMQRYKWTEPLTVSLAPPWPPPFFLLAPPWPLLDTFLLPLPPTNFLLCPYPSCRFFFFFLIFFFFFFFFFSLSFSILTKVKIILHTFF